MYDICDLHKYNDIHTQVYTIHIHTHKINSKEIMALERNIFIEFFLTTELRSNSTINEFKRDRPNCLVFTFATSWK